MNLSRNLLCPLSATETDILPDDVARKGVIVSCDSSYFLALASPPVYAAGIERRRISSRAIIFYSAFADTGFTTGNNWRRSRRYWEAREIKKEYEKRL